VRNRIARNIIDGMDPLYTATATAAGDGRNGHVRSSDGLLDTDVRIPAEMGGPGGATNPEQLFAAGYAACFHSALRVAAREQKADVTGSTVTADVSIGRSGNGGFGLAVALTVSLPAVDQEEARKLTARAHEVCPYSNATRGNIDVTLNIA
jgi:Ohr subfamily peroxiredoxin